MTIVITLKVLLAIILFVTLNYLAFYATAYYDVRYLKSDPDFYDDAPIAVPYIFGMVFIVVLGGAWVIGKLKLKIPKATDLAKKHRAQDEDVTYQLEKHLLDKK